MRLTSSPRVVGLAGLVLATLLASSSTVMAGESTPPPPPTSSGKVGTFRIVESEASPAAVCSYDDSDGFAGNNFLYRIALAAPKVKAAPGRGSQRVAWRLVIQGWDEAGSRWFAYAHSTWTKGTAKAATAATLAKRSVRVHPVSDPPLTTNGMRAKAEIRWYGQDGSKITGRGSVWATWYTQHEPPTPDVTYASPRCGETTG